MNRWQRFCAGLVLVLVSLAVGVGSVQAAPPNILLIITDDQGYGDVGANGNEWISTPNMDRIAAEGARFERFFVEPVCAPTRAALLSGRYPTRVGVTGVTRNLEVMRGDEVTLAEILRDHGGYATGCFGKWHNGAHWPYHPNAQGFDEFVGFCGGHWNDYFDPDLERNGKAFSAQGFIADVLTDHALRFIGEQIGNDKPFFCYVPYNTPHTPASVPIDEWREWKERDDVEDPFTRTMYALCENIDDNIGRLLTGLDDLEIADDTIVLFMTDNGPNGPRFNDHMLGAKGSEMEGGVRVPLFVRWPGHVPRGLVVEENVAHIDLLPTLSELAGVDLAKVETKPLDGIDISPVLLGSSEFVIPDRYHYTWRNPKRWSIRSRQYRATATTLHDLFNDPSQQKNLARDLPLVHQEMVAAYREWQKDAVPSSPVPEPVQIGYEEQPTLTLKAHELDIVPGEGQGIHYCELRGFANQWIERWSDLSAWAECPLRAVEEGRYRVSVRYAADADQVGSEFRLSAAGDSLDFAIVEPWVSAVYPASEQVSKRGGGYLSRAWKTVPIGEMDLRKGDGLLKLEAVKRSGAVMPAIKALVFERL